MDALSSHLNRLRGRLAPSTSAAAAAGSSSSAAAAASSAAVLTSDGSMFALPLKQTERVDYSKSLHGFVEESYSLEQADEHRDAFAAVQTLREKVRTATLTEKGAEETVRLIARYYRVLTSVRTRFGTAVDDSDGRAVFVWRDAWKTSEKCALSDLQFERAAVLFNLAAAPPLLTVVYPLLTVVCPLLTVVCPLPSSGALQPRRRALVPRHRPEALRR